MKERSYVKFKLNMYDDTKTKIIDQRPERDFIHYFFARSIILAGKADYEGNLYMAKNIPYTIETLAIEFNRNVELIKLALKVLIQLEMIEVTEANIYRVKNFAKHQNIKVKENVKMNSQQEVNISNKEAQIEEDKQIDHNHKNKIQEKNENYEFETERDKNEIDAREHINNAENIGDNVGNSEVINLDIKNADANISSNVSNTDSNISEQRVENNFIQDNLVVLEKKNNKNSCNKKKKNNLDTEIAVDEIKEIEEDDDPMFSFS